MVNYTATLATFRAPKNPPAATCPAGFCMFRGVLVLTGDSVKRYTRSVRATLLLDLRGLLAEWHARRECAHVMTVMTDGPVCWICGGQWPWRRGEGNSDDDEG